MEISCLAEELLEHIFSHLSVVQELQIASRVCQLWRKICWAVYVGKHRQFRAGTQLGRFVWRQVGQQTQQPLRSHFVPRHLRRIQLSDPSARSFPHCVFHENFIYVHGGSTGKTYFNDMHRYDLLTDSWEKVAVSGTAPTPRSNTSVTKLGDTLVLTGGTTHASQHSMGQTQMVHRDIYFYDLAKSVWFKSGEGLGSPRSDHASLCMGDPANPTLVVVGGTSGRCFDVDMARTVDTYRLSMGDAGVYTATPGKKFSFLTTRMLHCLVKIDSLTALVYGGRTPHVEQIGMPHFRTDAWLLRFNPSFTDCEFSRVSVEGQDTYNGLYPAYVRDFARVNDCLIFFQKSMYIKASPEYDVSEGICDFDEERKPTGDEIYRQDYFHTFILDISGVSDRQTVRWLPVSKNPPLLAPRYRLLHATVRAGDALYVFGGSIVQRSREPEASNHLYKITVLKDVVR